MSSSCLLVHTIQGLWKVEGWVREEEDCELSDQGSCLVCGQMLVAEPAGGGWAHLSPALPFSLFSTVEEATDGVRRFCSGPSAASSICPAPSRPDLKAPCQGRPIPNLPPPQGSTVYREGSPPTPASPTNTVLPPGGRKQQLHLCFWSPGLAAESISLHRQSMPSQGLSTMLALRWSQLDAARKPLVFLLMG